jgi:hypothetical protein
MMCLCQTVSPMISADVAIEKRDHQGFPQNHRRIRSEYRRLPPLCRSLRRNKSERKDDQYERRERAGSVEIDSHSFRVESAPGSGKTLLPLFSTSPTR